jgi:hypothetical protein
MESMKSDNVLASNSINGIHKDRLEPIAIVGMATRFPQDATTTENLWTFLLKGRNAHTSFPKERIDADGHYHPDPEHGGTVSHRKRETAREIKMLRCCSSQSRAVTSSPKTQRTSMQCFSVQRKPRLCQWIHNRE